MNFMDDVGQTLLNWASAFGTLEMVISLLACLSYENCSVCKNRSFLVSYCNLGLCTQCVTLLHYFKRRYIASYITSCVGGIPVRERS